MQVVLSGSSLIQLNDGQADLSRRIIPFNMPGLSFREFLYFDQGIELPPITLEELLAKPDKFCMEVRDKDFDQIKDAENGYIAADNIESAYLRKIPLWAFGFLY